MARSTRGGGTDAGFGEATARREAERVSRRQDEKQRRERRDEERGGHCLGATRPPFNGIPFFGNKDPPAEGALQQIEQIEPPL
jgi:hypothetical protein